MDPNNTRNPLSINNQEIRLLTTLTKEIIIINSLQNIDPAHGQTQQQQNAAGQGNNHDMVYWFIIFFQYYYYTFHVEQQQRIINTANDDIVQLIMERMLDDIERNNVSD